MFAHFLYILYYNAVGIKFIVSMNEYFNKIGNRIFILGKR